MFKKPGIPLTNGLSTLKDILGLERLLVFVIETYNIIFWRNKSECSETGVKERNGKLTILTVLKGYLYLLESSRPYIPRTKNYSHILTGVLDVTVIFAFKALEYFRGGQIYQFWFLQFLQS